MSNRMVFKCLFCVSVICFPGCSELPIDTDDRDVVGDDGGDDGQFDLPTARLNLALARNTPPFADDEGTLDVHEYELGERFYFSATTEDTPIAIGEPIEVEFVFSKPDGSSITFSGNVQNDDIFECWAPGGGDERSAMTCLYHGKDPDTLTVQIDGNGTLFPVLSPQANPSADEIRYGRIHYTGPSASTCDDPVYLDVDQLGTYELSATSIDGTVSFESTRFDVTLATVDSVILHEAVAEYELVTKTKVPFSGSYEKYEAFYLGTDIQPETACEGELEHIEVTVGLTASSTEASEELGKNGIGSDDGTIEVSGQHMWFSEGQASYNSLVWERYKVAWYSGPTFVLLNGLGTFESDEEEFVSAYLEMYPSDLEP